MEEAARSMLSEVDPGFSPAQYTTVVGDASGRRYFRLTSPARPGVSYMLMVLGSSGGNEELGGGPRPEELPFIYVQRVMAAVGLPVPKIFAFDEAQGLMILEDFGDDALESWQKERSEAEVEAMYTLALHHLVTLQVEGSRAVPAGGQVARQSFSPELLRAEIEHYIEFGLERRYRPLSSADRQLLDQLLPPLCEELALAPRVLVHRDYHSRNLMVTGGRLGIIDFQDALMGPAAYDVVSLLRDAYVRLPSPMAQRLLEAFLSELERRQGSPVDRAAFQRSFDLCSVQRCLKAAGRFDFFWFTRGNDRYVPCIPNCLRSVAEALSRHTDLAPLQQVFGRYVPGLAAGEHG